MSRLAIPTQLIGVDLARSVSLAARLAVYAHDAYVIDCARSEGTLLLSLDGGQKQAATEAGVSLHPH